MEAGGKQSTMILWKIMDRIRKSSSFVSIYKKRLLEAGVIGGKKRGIQFVLPAFRDNVRRMEEDEPDCYLL